MTLEESRLRFWSHVNMDGLDECWPWKGRVNWAGYGSFSAENREWRANRVAWMLANGALQKTDHVLHRCDNPPCCNPRHLFLGNPTINAKDRDTKGRGVPPARCVGEETTAAKLTTAEVLEIRRRADAGETYASIARLFCVKQGAIGKIVRRERWSHL